MSRANSVTSFGLDRTGSEMAGRVELNAEGFELVAHPAKAMQTSHENEFHVFIFFKLG